MEKGLETFPIQRIINEPYVCIQSNRLFTTLQRPSILKYILSVMVILLPMSFDTFLFHLEVTKVQNAS